MADTSYSIDIQVAHDKVQSATAALTALEAKQETVSAAATAAATALAAANTKFAQLEGNANRAASALESISAKTAAAKENLDIASQANVSAADLAKLTSAYEGLSARQSELQAKSDAAKAAMDAQAAAVDALAAEAQEATAAETALAASIDAATTEADEAASAMAKVESSLPTGKVNEMGEAFGRFGGPVGRAGQKITGLVDGFGKMSSAAGPTVAAIAGVAAAAALLVVGLAAAAVGIAKLAWEGVKLADKEKRIDAMGKKLKSGLRAIFGGLKVGPLLDGMERLVNLFDENTVVGKALAFLFETMFQPLIDGVTAALPTIERMFLKAITYALKLYIALAKFAKTDTFDYLVTGLKVVAVGIAAVLAIAAVAGALIAAPFFLAAAAITFLAGVITTGLGAAWEWLSSLDFGQIATDLINGLVNGISSGVGLVVDAIRNLGASAMSALKSILGIASPSKEFAKLGGFTAAGFSEGIEGGTAETQGALESMVAPPDVAVPGAGDGGGRKIEINIGTLQVSGGSAREMAEDFLKQLTAALEGDALALGAGEAPA